MEEARWPQATLRIFTCWPPSRQTESAWQPPSHTPTCPPPTEIAGSSFPCVLEGENRVRVMDPHPGVGSGHARGSEVDPRDHELIFPMQLSSALGLLQGQREKPEAGLRG